MLILGQLGKLLGISSDEDGAIREAVDIIRHLGDANGATVVVAALSFGLLVILARISKRIPGALVLVVLGIAASWALDLASQGVAVTGPVPSGLPSLALPDVSRSDLGSLSAAAVAIFLVAFSDSILTSRSFAARHHEVVDANQELLAFGFAQMASRGYARHAGGNQWFALRRERRHGRDEPSQWARISRDDRSDSLVPDGADPVPARPRCSARSSCSPRPS